MPEAFDLDVAELSCVVPFTHTDGRKGHMIAVWEDTNRLYHAISPATTPEDLPSLSVWFDPSDQSEDSMTTAGTTSTGSSEKVSALLPKGGATVSATEGTDANRPYTGTMTINGRNIIEIGGTPRHLVLDAASTSYVTGDLSVWAVFKHSPAGNQALLYSDNGTSGYFGFILMGSNTIQFLCGGSTAFFNASSLDNTGPAVVSMVKSGTTLKGYLNGVLVGEKSGINNGTITNPVNVGRTPSGAALLNGGIGEFSINQYAVSEDERLKVEAYYQSRWKEVTSPAYNGITSIVFMGDSYTSGSGA